MRKKEHLILATCALVGGAHCAIAANADQQQAAQAANQLAAGAVKNALGNNMPAWLKRTDVSIEGLEHGKPTWSIETIQPLYQTPNSLRDTLFFQGRWAYRNDDNTVNLGVGYRRLLDDQTWLLGVNGFFDTTTRYSHQRVGLGAEAIGQYMTFRANYYDAISGAKTISSIAGVNTTEQAMDGYDFELDAPVPYLPWLRVAATSYRWKSATAGTSDLTGNKFALRGNITPSISFEIGRQDDNFNLPAKYVNISYNFGATPTNGVGGSLFGEIKSGNAFQARDLTKHTLDKVQRQNDIVVERKSGGVIIARGN